MMSEQHEWLRAYAQTRSANEFRRVVDTHVDFVYSVARRQVHDSHLAEDVTQAVFILLSRKALAVSATNRPVSAWLHRATCYVAANARRAESSRRAMERRFIEEGNVRRSDSSADETQAQWESLSPLLDEGLSKLRSGDRDAILLKFFERKTHREIGDAMGLSEQAAAKRVSRAVERLRAFFHRRGVVIPAAALAIALTSRATIAAPASLSVSAVAASVASGAAPASSATLLKGVLIMTSIEKVKVAAVVAAALLLCGGGGAYIALRDSSQAQAPKVQAPQAQAPQVQIPQPQAPLVDTSVVVTANGINPQSKPSVKFSDGTAITLLGIAEGHGPAQTWWGGDGSPVPAPVYPHDGSFISIGDQTAAREVEFIFGIDGSAIPDKTISMEISPNRGYASGRQLTAGGWMLKLTAAIPAGRTSVDLNLGVAHEPWTPHVLWERSADGTTNIPATAPARVLSIREEKGETLVEIPTGRTGISGNGAERLEAKLADGRSITYSIVFGQQGKQIYHFKCRQDQLAQIILGTRKFERAKISNIAVSPAIAHAP